MIVPENFSRSPRTACGEIPDARHQSRGIVHDVGKQIFQPPEQRDRLRRVLEETFVVAANIFESG